MITLGSKVKDSVTGFTGITTAKAEYMNGCIQYRIDQAVQKNGDTKTLWADEKQIIVLGGGIAVKKKRTGGPQRNPPTGNM